MENGGDKVRHVISTTGTEKTCPISRVILQQAQHFSTWHPSHFNVWEVRRWAADEQSRWDYIIILFKANWAKSTNICTIWATGWIAHDVIGLWQAHVFTLTRHNQSHPLFSALVILHLTPGQNEKGAKNISYKHWHKARLRGGRVVTEVLS